MKTLLLLFAACSLQASVLQFASLGTAADANQFRDGGPSIAIAPHPLWADPLPGSSWVSYGNTGDPSADGYFVPGPATVMTFYQMLTIPGVLVGGTVTLRADDSAAFYVNSQLVVPEAPIVGNTYAVCSDFAVGCRVGTEVTVDITPWLHVGENMLTFDVAQRRGASFGLNYAGSVEWNRPNGDETPEPGAWLLVLFGLSAIGIGSIRKTARKDGSLHRKSTDR